MQEQHLDEEYASYLICCAMWPRFSRGKSRKEVLATLNLIIELLNRGGNPNLYVGHPPTTVWGRFLGNLSTFRFCAPTALKRTMEAFLDSGADVHTEIPNPVAINNLDIRRAENTSLGGPEICFRHQRSPLNIIRSWLEEIPELKSIEDMILAKGGRDSYDLTHVALRSDGYRPHKLSQRRRDRLIAASDHDHPNHEHVISILVNVNISKGRRWAEQFEKIHKGILDNRPDSESSASSDEDDASDDGAEEDFFEPMDLPNLEEMQE